ncbi:shikimate kinase [Thermodesulfobacteriota bacterium]
MSQNPTNIILIGMPGSGKSTVGVILAKVMSRTFIDTDLIIQTSQNRSLQDIVDKKGHMALRKIEAEILLGLNCSNSIIATGGSAVYSHAAISHLKSNGIAVFLNVDLTELEARIHDFETRGLAKRPDQNLNDLFRERLDLYKKYSDVTIDCKGLTQEEVCDIIVWDVEPHLAIKL